MSVTVPAFFLPVTLTLAPIMGALVPLATTLPSIWAKRTVGAMKRAQVSATFLITLANGLVVVMLVLVIWMVKNAWAHSATGCMEKPEAL